VRILIVEDDIYQISGVSESLLSRGAEVKSASDFTSALHWVVEWQPEVVLLDLLIPLKTGLPRTEQEAHGLYLAKEIKRLYPQMGVVFHSAHLDFQKEIFKLIEQYKGGIGAVYKGEQPPATLWDIIKQVAQGKVVLDEYLRGKPPRRWTHLTAEEQDMAAVALNQIKHLSDKQIEIIKKVAASLTNAGIARDLKLKPSTVDSYLSKIYSDLGLAIEGKQEIIDRRAIITKVYQIYQEERATLA